MCLLDKNTTLKKYLLVAGKVKTLVVYTAQLLRMHQNLEVRKEKKKISLVIFSCNKGICYNNRYKSNIISSSANLVSSFMHLIINLSFSP